MLMFQGARETIVPMHVFTLKVKVFNVFGNSTTFANGGFFEYVEYFLEGWGPPRIPGGAATPQRVFNIFEETDVCERCVSTWNISI